MLAKLFQGWNTPAEPNSLIPDGADLKDRAAGRRPWVLHPVLVGVFPILSVYSHNVFELPLTALLWPIGLALGMSAACWLILRLVTRDTIRAGLATTLLVALFFGYQSMAGGLGQGWELLISQLWVNRNTYVHPLVVLAFEVIAAGVGIWVVFWRVRQPRRWNTLLNAFTLILVALPTVNVVSAKLGELGKTSQAGGLTSLGQAGSTPDIYFIVLDGYARSDLMNEVYGFDNRPFLDRLERRGFQVAKQSTSNYAQTMLSVASTLNMDYLDKLIAPGTHDLRPLIDQIKDNRVSQLLGSRGYKSVAFSTGFEPTDLTEAELYLAPGPNDSAFQEILIEMTPLSILAGVKWDDRFARSRNRTLFLLDRLPSIARIPGPTFTFAHIVSPHPPFIFGENGEDVSPRSFGPNYEFQVLDPFIGTPEYVRKAYRAQAVFLTARVDRMIDQILAESPQPPVIILQSDHGAWLHYHANDAEATEVRDRFATLNAILIPGRSKIEGFSDDACSVNTFRIVLNNLFEANLPLLEPRSYFSTVLDPLALTEVTQRLHSEEERTRKFQPPKKYLGLIEQY